MGRNKLPNRFGEIPQYIWDKIPNKDKQFLFKYDYYRRSAIALDEKIQDLEEEIRQLKKDKEKFRKKSEQVWVENRHRKEDYLPKFNITNYAKKTPLKSKRKGFNKVGKSISQRKEEQKILGWYWNINVKYKGLTKSIYLGSNDKVKAFIKEIEWVKDNQDTLGIVNLNELTREEVKHIIDVLVRDNLDEMITSADNFFNRKVTLEELVS